MWIFKCNRHMGGMWVEYRQYSSRCGALNGLQHRQPLIISSLSRSLQYKSSPFIPSLLMTHTFVCYNRICPILKRLNHHIQYGHHFKALGMYFKTMMKFMAKCNSIWSFLSEVSPATRNYLLPADSTAICIYRKLLLVRALAGSWMRNGALLATENRLLVGHLRATPLFATAQVVHFPI